MTRKRRQLQLFERSIFTCGILVLILLLIPLSITSSENQKNQDGQPDDLLTNITISPTPDTTQPLPDDSNNENGSEGSSDNNEDEDNNDNENTPAPADETIKYIALTYDDGPSSYTSSLLDILEKNNAKATFFVVGNRVEQRSETIQRMDSLGMEIGSHTYDHATMTELDAEQIVETMQKTDEALTNIIGHGATVMRPVGGNVNEVIQENVGKPIIRWNVDTEDWKSRDTQMIVDHILEHVHDGCIILMHDIYPTTIEACEIVIPKLQEMGYQLVTIQELADIRGITLEDGEIYGHFFPNTAG